MLLNCRIVLGLLTGCVFLMGAQFMYSALNGGIPMPPETHGRVVHNIPAEFWAGLYMTFSGLMVYGFWRLSAIAVRTGAAIGVVTNVVFAAAASEADFGYLLQAGATRDAMWYAVILIYTWSKPFKEA